MKYTNTNTVKNEPMIFSGCPDFAHSNGGPLTREITKLLLDHEMFRTVQMFSPEDFRVVIDTRVTMTMEGMYPSIPGWHGDDFPRSKTTGQPVLHGVNPLVQHFMVLLSDQPTAVSTTEFILKPTEIDVDLANVWNSVDTEINARLKLREDHYKNHDLEPMTGFIEPGEIVRFNQEAIHRASPTVTPGWRFFYRASITHRQPANEVRKQVQVYASQNGW
jgi:hypothetical protein